ncbi:MAG TPA: hypothetical protein VF000_01710 [Agromyces sp.]|jgi:hypothetical protein
MSSSDATRGIPSPTRTQPKGRSLRWRREQLMAAGYDELSAQRLAVDASVDIHAMIVEKEQHPSHAGRGRAEGSVTPWVTTWTG